MKFANKLVLRMLEGLQGGSLELVCPNETYNFGLAEPVPETSLHAVIAIHDERDKEGHGPPQPSGAFQGVFVVRMSLRPHEDTAVGRRSFQRHRIAR